MIRIYYTHIHKLPDDLFKKKLGLLPQDIQKRIERFHRWQDAHACLTGRLLLREGLINYGFTNDVLNQIKYTTHNRPYLNETVDFNISHSGNIAVCAVSDTSRIGIDVERIQNISLKDFRSQFSDQEWMEIIADKNSHNKFYSYWTKKEAVIKADGKGLHIPLNKITLKGDYAEAEGKQWRLEEINLNPDEYKICLARDLKADETYSIQNFNML